MKKTLLTLTLAGSALFGAAPHKTSLPFPRAARTIACGDDPIPVQFLKGQAVFFEFPKGELVFNVMLGNDQQWQYGTRDMDPKNPPPPSRFVPVIAEAKGANTIINLISSTQHRCVIQAEEISGKGGEYDTTLRIEAEAGSAGPDGAVSYSAQRWVPVDQAKEEHEGRLKAEKALQDAKAGLQAQIDRGVEEYRAKYPESIHHDYTVDPVKAAEWGNVAAWHDCCRTFIEGRWDRDLPVLYTTREGKPHPLVNARYDKGKYTVPELLSSFYLIRAGKGKKNELHFTENREGEGQ